MPPGFRRAALRFAIRACPFRGDYCGAGCAGGCGITAGCSCFRVAIDVVDRCEVVLVVGIGRATGVGVRVAAVGVARSVMSRGGDDAVGVRASTVGARVAVRDVLAVGVRVTACGLAVRAVRCGRALLVVVSCGVFLPVEAA